MVGKVIGFATPLQTEMDLNADPSLAAMRMKRDGGREGLWKVRARTAGGEEAAVDPATPVGPDKQRAQLSPGPGGQVQTRSQVQANYKESGRRKQESRVADSAEKLLKGSQVAAEDQV